MNPAVLLDELTDTLPPRGRVVPHWHVIVRRMPKGVSLRFVVLRAAERKPPVPMGRLHMSSTLWLTALEPALRAMRDAGAIVLTVDDQG